MTSAPVASVTDELLAEIERECRTGADDHAGMGNEEESALFDRIGNTVSACAAELRRLRAEAQALRVDAGRYQIVKTMCAEAITVWRGFYGFADEAVDTYASAMQSNTEGN